MDKTETKTETKTVVNEISEKTNEKIEEKTGEKIEKKTNEEHKFMNMKKKNIKNFLQLFLNYHDFYTSLLNDQHYQNYYIATQFQKYKSNRKHIFSNNAKITNALNKI